MTLRNFLSLSLCLLLTSCGYQSLASANQQTLSIPYVRGDEEGFLTTALIAEFDQSGLYDYVNSAGDLELKVALVGSAEEVIGYRYNRSKTGDIEQNLMETENRRHASAEITLYRASEEIPILGPLVVTAFAEFDYNDVSSIKELAFVGPHGRLEKVIDFSQGQLDSIEGGQDNVRAPLYALLAKKIAAVTQRAAFEGMKK